MTENGLTVTVNDVCEVVEDVDEDDTDENFIDLTQVANFVDTEGNGEVYIDLTAERKANVDPWIPEEQDAVLSDEWTMKMMLFTMTKNLRDQYEYFTSDI